MKDTEKLRAYAARLKEAQKYNTEIGYSDIAVDALLDCCETLANLLDQIDRANEFMKEKGLIK
jgi:hypothetical protein